MDTIRELLQTHPKVASSDLSTLAQCIDACFRCAETCSACADACLAEKDVQMLIRCIRLNMDCADVCSTTGRMLTRQLQPDAGLVRSMLEVCAQACRVCGDECTQHAGHHDHCRVCAEQCDLCEQACMDLLNSMTF